MIEAYDEAWNQHALEAILACYTFDSVFESHTTAEIATGHDAIRRMIARYFRTFPDLAFAIRRMYARTDLVVQEWTAQATHTVPIPTRQGLAAPTGRVLTWRGVDIMPMAGELDCPQGRVCRQRRLAAPDRSRSLATIQSRPLMGEVCRDRPMFQINRAAKQETY